MKRLVFLMVMGGAIWASLAAIAPPQPRPAATASVVALAPASNATARLGDRLGRLGSRVATPFVRSIAQDTERLLHEVSPLIPKANAREAMRARALSKQILATDSAAFVQLNEGHPVRAIKLAWNARGLIPAVRQNVAEERAFQQ